MSIARVLLSLFSLAWATGAVAGTATDYPSRPIQVIVPYGPGGSADVVGRIISEHMASTLGQPVVVQNRPGADANIGPRVVAQAEADGYTLLASSNATVVNPVMEPKLNWSTRDFVPIARYAQAPSAIVVPASLKVATLSDFVALAKATPGGLATSVTGPGSSQSMARESFANAADIELLRIGYKGGVSFIADLVSGTLAMSVAPVNVVLKLVEDGRLVALANTSDRRSALLPDVPTIAESGYPEATVVSWLGLHAPHGTPPEIVEKLAEAVHAATRDEQVKARMSALGLELVYLDTPDFAVFLAGEQAKAEKFAKALAIK